MKLASGVVSMSDKPEIYVDCEYGDLKEVIVGVPLTIYPEVKPSGWMKEALKILPESEQKKIMERLGKSSLEIGKYDATEKENLELISIFQRHGIKVWRIEVMTRERLAINLGEEVLNNWGVSFQYSRDPILVVGNNVIELTPGSLFRLGDLLAYRKLFVERVLGSNARWFAMPKLDYSQMFQNDSYRKDGFPVLEGGDIHVLGKKILVGNSQNPAVGSSELGFSWLKSILGPQGYDVERVPIGEEYLHLDVALSVVRPGLAVLCPEAFVEGVPSYFDGWKLIEVSKGEAQRLATNGLPIDPNHYILSYNEHYDGWRVQKALEAEGVTVYRIFFGNHNEDGGSVRCATHPLVRKLSSPA